MKKILALVLFALISATSFAESEVPIIVKGGMGIGTWYGSDATGCKARLAWKFGVGTSFDLGSNFAIQPYIFMEEKGAKFDGTLYYNYAAYDGHFSVHEDYIQIPILVAYNIPVGDEANVTINLGPYVAYGIGGKTKVPFQDSNIKTFTKEHEGMGFKKFDAGIQFGVSGDYNNIILGVDGEFGLTRLVSNEKFSNFAAFVNVGYKF